MKFTGASVLALVAAVSASPLSSYPGAPAPTPTPSSIMNLSTGYPSVTPTNYPIPPPPMGTGTGSPVYPGNATSITYSSPSSPPTGSPTGPGTVPSGGAAVHGVGLMAIAGAAAAYML